MVTRRKLPLTLAFVVLVGLAFGASCNGFFVDPVLTTIAVGPDGQNVQFEHTLQMSARGTYDNGDPPKNITGSVLWSSSDDTIAKIVSGGLVTAQNKSGKVTISASLDTITGSAEVNVVLSGVTAITIKPTDPQDVKVGNTIDLTCLASVTGQNPVDITDTVVWTSDDATNITITDGTNPAVVTVGASTALGAHIITATYTVGTTEFTDTETLNVKPVQ